MGTSVGLLFEPLTVKGLTLRNRLVLPPMVPNRFLGGEDGRAWYGARAGGVGLVILEATAVERFGRDLTVENLKALADVVHGAGAALAIQLFPVTFGTKVAPADLTPARMAVILEQYRVATRMCVAAGFEGVEPHGAHGYVLNQFFSPARNTRTDEYGAGTPAGRMRYGLEVARACRAELGASRLLLYRHTPVEDGSYGIEDSLAFAAELVAAGVDILDISPASDKLPADRAAPFRRCGVPVIAVNGMDRSRRAVEALREGRADLIAVGRGLIADPQWVQKVRAGRSKEIIRCVRCNEGCFGRLRQGLPIGCMKWPGGPAGAMAGPVAAKAS